MKHYAQVLPEHFESAVNGDREKAAHFPAQQVAAEGEFHVAASRTTKNSDDENALENKAFQAVEENNEETKNRGDTIRIHSVLSGNIVPDGESGAESGAVQVALCRVFDSWGSLTADDRRRILAIVDGRLA